MKAPSLKSFVSLVSGVVFFGSSIALWWWARRQIAEWQLAALGLWLVLLAVFQSLGWIQVIGSVFYCDLLRESRNRWLLWRTLGITLFGVVFGLLLPRFQEMAGAPAFWNEILFYALLAAQLLAVAAYTPMAVVLSIAEEKDPNRFETLLTTDLNSGEIVLSRVAASLVKVGTVLIAGLPVVLTMPLQGGIDPFLIPSCYAAILAFVFGLSGLSAVLAVEMRRPLAAIGLAYLALAAYGIFCYVSFDETSFVLVGLATACVFLTIMAVFRWHSPQVGWMIGIAFLGIALVPGLTPFAWQANFVSVYADWRDSLVMGDAPAEEFGPRFHKFASWLILYGILCLAWAAFRFRGAALAVSHVAPAKPKKKSTRKGVLSVPDYPMFWKEFLRTRWKTTIAIGFLGFVASFAISAFFFPTPIDSIAHSFAKVTALFAVLSLGVVALQAAGSLTSERTKDTLDGLLVTPLEGRALFGSKWLTSIAAPSWFLGCFLAIPFVALLTNSRVFFVATMLPGWFIYAALCASVGLYSSIVCRTTQRAVALAFVLLGALSFGHWLLWPFYVPYFMVHGTPREDISRLLCLHLALTPPVTLAWLAHAEWTLQYRHFTWHWIALGLGADAAIAILVTGWGYLRFLLANHRFAQSKPDRDQWRHTRTAIYLRRSLAIIVPAGCLVAVVLIWQALYDGVDRRLQAMRDQLDRDDPSWSMPRIVDDRPPIPMLHNSAMLVVDMKAAGWGLLAQAPLANDVENTPVNARLKPAVRDQLEKAMRSLAPTIDLGRQLKDMRQGRFPSSYNTTTPFLSLLPHVMDAREAAAIMRLDAILRADQGDLGGALESCRATLNAGRTLFDEPSLIAVLVRLAIQGMALKATERVLAQGEPPDKELLELQRALEAEEKDTVFLQALRGERAFGECTLKQWRKNYPLFVNIGITGPLQANSADDADKSALDFLINLLLSASSSNLNQLRYLEYFSRAEAASRLPLPEQKKALESIDTTTSGFLVQLILPALDRAHGAFLRAAALNRCTICAIAAERFRQSKGRWCDSLEELVDAGFLTAMPEDPYTGKPLRLLRTDHGLAIYSLGPVDRDLKGVVDWSSATFREANFGVKLWDPDKRGSNPPTNAPPP